jgi:hypothetical protein
VYFVQFQILTVSHTVTKKLSVSLCVFVPLWWTRCAICGRGRGRDRLMPGEDYDPEDRKVDMGGREEAIKVSLIWRDPWTVATLRVMWWWQKAHSEPPPFGGGYDCDNVVASSLDYKTVWWWPEVIPVFHQRFPSKNTKNKVSFNNLFSHMRFLSN